MAEGLAKDPQPSGYMWRSSLMRWPRTLAVYRIGKLRPLSYASGMRHARKVLLQAARQRRAGCAKGLDTSLRSLEKQNLEKSGAFAFLMKRVL